MKKSAAVTLTVLGALGAAGQAQTVPACDPSAPSATSNVPCKVKKKRGAIAAVFSGFGKTGAGKSAGS
jgi:hypothetical protein